MMFTNKTQFISALLLLSISVLQLGCADKNVNDYRKSYALQQVAKNQSVAGTYRGSLVSIKDQTYMGDVAVMLQSEIRPITSQDQLSTEMQAVINADVTLTGFSPFTKQFHNCQYDVQSHALNCEDATQTLILEGTVNGSSFQGTIQAEGLGSNPFGGKISTTKDAPAQSTASVQSKLAKTGTLVDRRTQVFTGKVKFLDDGSEDYLALVITTPEATSDVAFNNIFTKVKSVSLGLSFIKSGTRVNFPAVSLDESSGEFTGSSTPTTTDGEVLGIKCSRTTPDGKNLSCDMTASSNAYIFQGAKFILSNNKVNSISAGVSAAGKSPIWSEK